MEIDDPFLRFAQEAVRARPRVNVSAALFAEHLRRQLSAGDAPALAALHGADLLLAFGCMRGDEGAWRELDGDFLANVAGYVRAIDGTPAFADDVRQRLAEKLACGDDGATSKLSSYSGRGPLWAWVRMAAIREAQSLVRARRPSVDADALSLASDVLDPEHLLLKQDGKATFRRAFDEVVASLPHEERSVLKLHYLDGLTLDEVAKAFRVSRATAARLVAQAREKVARRFERRLRDELGAVAPNAASLLALVESQLGASIGRSFGDPQGDA